jgi:hypothetical protein
MSTTIVKIISSVALASIHFGAVAAEEYKLYENGRYDFSIAFPSEELAPQAESENGDGRQFKSKDGKSIAWVWGANRSKELDRACSAFYEIPDINAPNITYKKKNGGISIISGYRNAKIFYKKCIQMKDRCLTFEIEYPIEDRKKFDAITARMAESLKGYVSASK